MEISEDLRCVFSADVEERDGSYVIEVPEREIDLESIREGAVYRVAVLDRHEPAGSGPAGSSGGRDAGSDTDGSTSDPATDGASVSGGVGSDDDAGTDSTSSRSSGGTDRNGNGSSAAASGEPEPPVDRGDEVTVDIEGIGDQGDGIARVDRGYVIIVPDTEKGERVSIRVTSVKQNVAFAEVVDRIERQQYE